MSLPVEKVSGCVNEVRLRDHVVHDLLIEKYLDASSCVALAISEKCDGFSSLYTTSRARKGLIVNQDCFFFTPTSWNQFIDQYIYLDSIKVCNLKHLYWLPSDLLVSTILQMPNLEELSIKGTKVCTFRQVAKILKACPKVVKLDFTYTEQKVEEIWSSLKMEEISRDDLVAGFQKLTELKLSTIALDSKNDILNDPWYLIINILTWCRDCKDLTVEITYAGAFEPDWSDAGTASRNKHRDVQRTSWDDWLPKLGWMFSLESLILIKTDSFPIISRLHDDLWSCLFPCGMKKNPDRTILPLRCLWLENFEVGPSVRCVFPLRFVNPDCLQSFNSGKIDMGDRKLYETGFFNLESLSAMQFMSESDSLLPEHSKLKFYCGIFNDEASYKFSQTHSNLEHLTISYQNNYLDVPSDAVCKLQKLKSFICFRDNISKEFVEAMVEAYPILKILRLNTAHLEELPPDDKVVFSAFRFPHLTTLSLRNFQLLDGSALISIINGCPKLEMVHLDTDSLDSSSFATNFEVFLQSATKLRDFRLRWNHHEEDVYPVTASLILKAFLKEAIRKESTKTSIHETKLERLALIDAGTVDLPDWNHPPDFADFLVDFTAKMTHLTCCCLTFKQMDGVLMKAIKERVEEVVVIERPSLWFHLSRDIPNVSDPGVPAIHYHQMVNPMHFYTPPFYSV